MCDQEKPITSTEVLAMKIDTTPSSLYPEPKMAWPGQPMETSGAPIVAMCEHQGQLFVATSEGVYRFNGEKFEKLIFVEPTEGMALSQ